MGRRLESDHMAISFPPTHPPPQHTHSCCSVNYSSASRAQCEHLCLLYPPCPHGHPLIPSFRFEPSAQVTSPTPRPPSHPMATWDMGHDHPCRSGNPSQAFDPSASSPWKECVSHPFIARGCATCLASGMKAHRPQRLEMHHDSWAHTSAITTRRIFLG